MSSTTTNYQQVLLETVLPKRKYKLSEVKDRIVRVAFDVVRFKDNDNLNLWKIESDNEGEYIVALYEDQEPEQIKTATLKNQWSAIAASNYITIAYQNVPVVKLSHQELDVEPSEVNFVASYLPKKLAENPKLRHALLNKITPDFRQNLISQFPELNND